jgi:ribosomal protein S27AE
METREIPEIVMKRKICESCGDSTFEFDLDTYGVDKYICGICSMRE